MTTTKDRIESDLDLLAALVRDARKARREGREPLMRITRRAAKVIERAAEAERLEPAWGPVSDEVFPDGSERLTISAGGESFVIILPVDGSAPMLDVVRDAGGST